ncbi:electron transfer flavoprotein subunit beta/FixA family protein [Acidiferrobacter thiooxydans]|jgi:electron transfer flavoprotein beta subunit|uniref:Protein FixA n=1 Tax=Acidiferrobacter thiooxydans TaxID=163359 RepID=A0A1C2G3W3_9GAMM|nr:electron transfer flavoprotein subunit beta/FixA family protein [Acidiferrobacter thiooxydans]MDA8119851.1 electron transfer flavoprotein subunit beta/FixA family protein [Gammaproteobacteria bacterium]MDA8191513.1 electron transfer flavoprotein subunit beta/FixA family protein [Gammaproteobacteria bacterium]RCN56787.1 electron transfer flavoprotein beta subunit/FixA family protein [Acidiferrobacter thiooxydans]UEN99467.1 electron transfer flavoprotein subunit beta/FixA family protein [Acidi
MHILVCIKQVPDSAQIRVHPVTNTIMRQGVPAIVNPYDLYALEEALRLKDRYRARVTVLCMGPPQAEAALRKALAFGADEAILLTDRAFAGADTLATSYALSAAIRQVHQGLPVDLVFAGKQTIDGDTAQVGPGIATRLDMQLLTYVSKIVSLDLTAREIVVHRRSEGGVQVLKTRLPALITVLEGINEMRFASLTDMFRAERHRLTIWSKDDAHIEDVTKIGLKGSPTAVSKVFAPTPTNRRAEIIETQSGQPVDLAATLVAKLLSRHPDVALAINPSLELDGRSL